MIYITDAPGGLLISRWEGDDTPAPLEQLYVSQDELAALLADLAAHAAGADDADAWDLYARLCGNDAAPALA